jgi:hypothetical protein
MSNSAEVKSIWDIWDVTKESTFNIIASVTPLTETLKRTADHVNDINKVWVHDSQARRAAESEELLAILNGSSTTSDEVVKLPAPKKPRAKQAVSK